MNRAVLALLVVACSAEPRLGVITQGEFAADPTSHDFGAIAVGGSDAKTIVISTLDDAGDDVTVTASTCTDFSMTLPSGDVHVSIAEPFALEVTFAPTTADAFACDVTFTGATTKQTVSFIGTGTMTGPVATLVAPPGGVIDFGEVPVTITSAFQNIEVRNDGTSTLTVLGTGFVAGGDDLTVTEVSSNSLEPGQSQTWEVTCTRTANGLTSGTFEITHDDPNLGPIQVEILCTGVTTFIYATPVPGVFGEVLVGGSGQIDFLLHNNGGSLGSIASVSITVDGPGTFVHDLTVGANVSVGGTLPFQVTFTPTGDGAVSGTLTIEFAGGGDALNVGLSGTGATALISVTPPDPVIDLGTACVGAMTERVHLGIRNAGTGAYQLAGVAFDPQYPFTGESFDTAPAVLPPGGTVEWSMDAWFEPTVAGEQEGALQINTNVPGDAAHRVPLRGRGLEASVGATAVSQDYGAVEVGDLSGAEALGVINCTGAGVVVAVALAGADADAFQILPGDPTADVTVGVGDTSTWSVLFQPTRAGAHAATLAITWADGSVEIPLSGLGVEDLIPDPDDDEGRGSYLACASSGGPGSLALVLVLLAIRIRARPRA